MRVGDEKRRKREMGVVRAGYSPERFYVVRRSGRKTSIFFRVGAGNDIPGGQATITCRQLI
jgi:hypothetical protein